ncbi:MAG TPA: hypothetical protein VFL91_20925 [Thermomicrobiales bacterium]|nr:hypothetical protein [Thermomicrobiales bacterium]
MLGLAVVGPAALGVGGAAGECYLWLGPWAGGLVGLGAGLPLALGAGWLAGRAAWPRRPILAFRASVWLAPRPTGARPQPPANAVPRLATLGGCASYLADTPWLDGFDPPR